MCKLAILLLVMTLTLPLGARAAADDNPIGVTDLPRVDRVTQGRITWHFAEPVPVGRFVNGDYYVVGPVTIKQIDPAPNEGRNGSVINLTAPDFKTRNASAQAFDSRYRGHKPELVAQLPIALKPGDMLVSSVSTDKKQHLCLFEREKNFSFTLSYAILTCLQAPVPPDTFRPGYCDRKMHLYRARDLQWDRLQKHQPVEETPDIDRWASLFRQPWIDLIGLCWGGAAEYQPQYARETARAEAFATLLLNLDFPREKKQPLLINFVQYGIDLWSIVRTEPDYRGWKANGGHGNGRKWAICFSGMMLGDKAMASPSISQPDFRFGMDMQTAYGPSWTGATVVYAGHWGLYKGELGGTEAEHQPYEHLQPRQWPISFYQYPWMKEPQPQYTGEAYRRLINSPVWVGIALAARIMKAEPFCAHDAFFDYVDRWMMEDDEPLRKKLVEQIDTKKSRHNFLEDKFHSGRVSDPFIEQMWKQYRAAPGMPPTDGWKKPRDHSAYLKAVEKMNL